MSEIKKRVLGRTGVEVSEVGFGGAPLGELFDNKGKIVAEAEEVFANFNRSLLSLESKFGIGEDAPPESEPEPDPKPDGDTVSPFEGGADPKACFLFNGSL